MLDILPLKKAKVYDTETHHRELINNNGKDRIKISYQIHRDSIIGEKFLPLIKHQDKIKKGFHFTKNATQYKEKDFKELLDWNLLERCKSTHGNYEIYIVKKRKAQEFLMKTGYKGVYKEEKKICKLLDDLSLPNSKEKYSICFIP